jgi:hypothetical protein
VTVYLVHSAHLSVTTNVPTFHWRVNAADAVAEEVVFELGFEDLLALNFPWQRFFRDHCRHVFKDSHCQYLSDEFGGDTEQVFDPELTTAQQGWKVLYSDKADRDADDVLIFDANRTNEDQLTIKVKEGDIYQWWTSDTEGPFLYRLLATDFDVSCRYTGTITAADEALLVVQSSTDTTDWVAIGALYSSGESEVRASITNGSGSTTQIRAAPIRKYWRIVRVGTDYTIYDKAKDSDDWTEITTYSRSDLSGTVKVGLAVGSRQSTGATAQTFDWIRFASGGETTCDYTLYGTTGCVARGNSRRFGAQPTIPYGPLVNI